MFSAELMLVVLHFFKKWAVQLQDKSSITASCAVRHIYTCNWTTVYTGSASNLFVFFSVIGDSVLSICSWTLFCPVLLQFKDHTFSCLDLTTLARLDCKIELEQCTCNRIFIKWNIKQILYSQHRRMYSDMSWWCVAALAITAVQVTISRPKLLIINRDYAVPWCWTMWA